MPFALAPHISGHRIAAAISSFGKAKLTRLAGRAGVRPTTELTQQFICQQLQTKTILHIAQHGDWLLLHGPDLVAAIASGSGALPDAIPSAAGARTQRGVGSGRRIGGVRCRRE